MLSTIKEGSIEAIVKQTQKDTKENYRDHTMLKIDR